MERKRKVVIPRSKYKHVHARVRYSERSIASKDRERWKYTFMRKGKKYSGYNYKTDKDAALACDMKLIGLGYDPVNILKKK